MAGVLRQTRRALSLFSLRPQTCGPTASEFPGKVAEACISGEARFFAKQATEVIPAAKSRGRPRKPEKEAWRKRVPSAYSRFVKETFPEASKEATGKGGPAVLQVVTKKWKEAPQSHKDKLQREYERDVAKRPKKPPSQAKLSAWTLFVRENYSRVASENPTVPARGMLSEVSKVWKSLSREETAYYTERAASENAARRSA